MNDQRASLIGPLRLLLVVIWISTSSTLGCSCFLKDRVNGISELEMEDDHGDSEVDFQDDFDSLQIQPGPTFGILPFV